MNTTLLQFLIFVPILSLLLVGLNLLLATKNPYESKISPYECGFLPHLGQTRSAFQIHFYIVAMFFLIFDLEILLLFPFAITASQISYFGFLLAMAFFVILTIGFILELQSGAIGLSETNTITIK